MIPILQYNDATHRQRVRDLLANLRLDPRSAASGGARDKKIAAVQSILADVAARGDAALVDVSRKFDDPNFSPDQIRVPQDQMQAAAARLPENQKLALRRSIAQVREYQSHIMPSPEAP